MHEEIWQSENDNITFKVLEMELVVDIIGDSGRNVMEY